MEKIKVNVCLGTSCFVIGRTILPEIKAAVEAKYGENVEIIGSPCLGLCSIKCENAKAPYVKVDDIIVEEATTEKVLAAIDKKSKLIAK